MQALQSRFSFSLWIRCFTVHIHSTSKIKCTYGLLICTFNRKFKTRINIQCKNHVDCIKMNRKIWFVCIFLTKVNKHNSYSSELVVFECRTCNFNGWNCEHPMLKTKQTQDTNVYSLYTIIICICIYTHYII